MSDVIVNHGHCRICGRAVPFGDATCSPECAGKFLDLDKRKRRTLLFYYGAAIAAIVLLAYQLGALF